MDFDENKYVPSYYVAVVVYEASSDAQNYVPLFEECFFLLQAESQKEAHQKALLRAQNAQTSYQNEQGETITWSLKTIVDVNSVIADKLEDGSEIYARHFRDYQAYEAFEPLLSKKGL